MLIALNSCTVFGYTVSMLHTLSFAGNPPVTPSLAVPCFRTALLPELTQQLAQAIVEERPRILAATPVPEWCQDVSSLTTRFTLYNLFQIDRPEFTALETAIGTAYKNYMTAVGYPVGPAYIRGWANAFTSGDGLVWHNHFEAVRGVTGAVWAHISGNVSVQTYGTKTWYLSPFLGGVGHDAFGTGYEYPADVVGVDNVDGEAFMFPSWLVHRTEPNRNPVHPRITIAYDIIPESVYLALAENSLFKQLIL